MKELDYIYTVYTEKSFSKAAKRLFVSQPALSMTVKRVEESLGIVIFDRSTVPLSPTDEGKVLISAIEQMRFVEKEMKEKLSDMTDLKIGHVSVSGENFVASFILPEILSRFTQKYKGIDIEIVESNSPELQTLVLTEAIDLLLAHDFDANLYESRELFDEKVLLAVPVGFEINDKVKKYAMSAQDIIEKNFKEAVNLSLFANEKFVALKPGNDIRRRANLLCAEAGFTPNICLNLDQLITAYNLCSFGMGLTFVSDILVEKSPAKGCLYYCLDSKNAYRKMSIGYKKNRYLTNAASAFIDTAVEVFKNR